MTSAHWLIGSPRFLAFIGKDAAPMPNGCSDRDYWLAACQSRIATATPPTLRRAEPQGRAELGKTGNSGDPSVGPALFPPDAVPARTVEPDTAHAGGDCGDGVDVVFVADVGNVLRRHADALGGEREDA